MTSWSIPEQPTDELRYYRHRKLLLESIERVARVGHFEWCPAEKRLLSCSTEYAEFFKLSVDEMLQVECSLESILARIHPHDREKFVAFNQALAEIPALDIEYRIVRQDGEVRDIRENSVAETDRVSGRRTVFGILQDITGLREDSNALEYREALAQQAESITEIGHFIYSEILGIYKYMSPGFVRIFSVTAEECEEMVISNDEDLSDIHPQDRHRVQAIYDRYDMDGQAYEVEYRILRPDGELRWVRERCVMHSGKGGKVIESLGVVQDITSRKNAEAGLLEVQSQLELTVSSLQTEIEERKKVEAQLLFLANHDALTSLPSLRLCLDRLDQALAMACRRNEALSVMFIDLDNFKQINDTHGHNQGDEVLRVTAERIRSCVRESDTAARIGGDEFLVVLPGLTYDENAERLAGKIISKISQDILIQGNRYIIGASIGIARYPENGNTGEQLIKQADKAMYQVKKQGKNNFGFAVADSQV